MDRRHLLYLGWPSQIISQSCRRNEACARAQLEAAARRLALSLAGTNNPLRSGRTLRCQCRIRSADAANSAPEICVSSALLKGGPAQRPGANLEEVHSGSSVRVPMHAKGRHSATPVLSPLRPPQWRQPGPVWSRWYLGQAKALRHSEPAPLPVTVTSSKPASRSRDATASLLTIRSKNPRAILAR
jgi:hypothetical protein